MRRGHVISVPLFVVVEALAVSCLFTRPALRPDTTFAAVEREFHGSGQTILSVFRLNVVLALTRTLEVDGLSRGQRRRVPATQLLVPLRHGFSYELIHFSHALTKLRFHLFEIFTLVGRGSSVARVD